MKLFIFLLFTTLTFAQSELIIVMGDDASFLPTDIPDINLWWNGSNPIYTGEDFTGATDLSGNSNDAEANNGALLRPDSLNGYSIFWFDGTDDYLQSEQTGIMNTSYTLFVVGKAYNIAGNGRILGNGTDNRGIYTNTTQWNYYSDVTVLGGTSNQWSIITLKITSATTAEAFLGETKIEEFAINSSTSNVIHIGSDNTQLNCAVAEVIGYARDLLDAECLLIIQYLNTKFGL